MENEETYDWRDEHGEPEFSYLEFLNVNGYVEAINKLQKKFLDVNVGFYKNKRMSE